MPPKLPAPGSPEDWLRYARSDLTIAGQVRVPEVLLETLCFHAQQAAEKSLKAVLVWRGVAFPFTHDLASLVTLVKQAGLLWPSDLDEVVELTRYASVSRYPVPATGISEERYRRAVEIAKMALDWAEKTVR